VCVRVRMQVCILGKCRAKGGGGHNVDALESVTSKAGLVHMHARTHTRTGMHILHPPAPPTLPLAPPPLPHTPNHRYTINAITRKAPAKAGGEEREKEREKG